MKPILRNLFRNKVTGETDSKIYNVVGDKVTLNREHKAKQNFVGRHSTFFKEIEVLPYTEAISPELLVAARQPQDRVMGEDGFFQGILETLKKYIEETWSPDKHHLVQHSSGLDSRVMSALIRQIHLERGADWLGGISFVAWGQERIQAAKIIKAAGWRHAPFYGLSKDDDYFNTTLDFDYAWKGLNGSNAYPINNPDWAFRELQRRGVISQDPDDTQVWAASWFNEVIKAKMGKQGFEDAFFKTYYYNSCSHMGAAYPFEFVQPLLNPDTIEHMARARLSLTGSHISIRGRLLKQVARQLTQFPRGDPASLVVPKRYIVRAVRDYRKSRYGKNKAMTHTDKVIFHPWWGEWSLASLVEHLVGRGVNVVGC